MSNLSIIVRHSRTFTERVLQNYEIGFPEQLIIMYLSKYKNVNQDTIANHFMIDKGSIAKTVGKLEEKNFIERTENPNNKREKLIQLTPKGIGMLIHMEKALKMWEKSIFEGLSSEDIERIEKLTYAMAVNIAKLEGKEWSNFDEDAK